MPRHFVFLIIGLFFGAGLGFMVAATTGATVEGHAHGNDAVHDHAAHDHGDGEHDHSKMTEVAGPAPGLEIVVHPDGPRSRNLEIATENFTFAPGSVNGPHVPGEGHAHVYLNGVKIARAYARWFHLSALPKGEHQLRVTLNANDHAQLAVNGTAVEATTTFSIE